jgi:signal transduction histidine kinase
MDARTFDELPIAALRVRAGRVAAANAAYRSMMGATEVVGRAVDELLGETPAVPSLRAIRRTSDDPEESVIFLLEDGGAHDAKNAAEALARAGTELARATTESEVLERAAEALAARGYAATFLLIVPGDALLAYGPTRLPAGVTKQTDYTAERVPRAVLEQLNPRFSEGRAAFLPVFEETVDAAFSTEIAEQLRTRRPGRHVMQAPLFVLGEPYGAFVLTSDAISPALCGSVEIFAAVLTRTIENLRMQRDLMQRERLAAIGEAAALMAHEVRNPVAALVNAVTLLRKRDRTSERRSAGTTADREEDELLDIISEEARSLEQIVSHLLALGRPITPRIVDEDLRTPTRRAVAAARAYHKGASIVLHDGALATAWIDPDLVQIAILNLLRNAVEASPEGANVDVFVEELSGLPAIRVDDRGPGIPSELTTRVLEPFFTTRPAGTGIGLAAVRRIVEACAGSVRIAATDGGGGRVTLSFRPAPRSGP